MKSNIAKCSELLAQVSDRLDRSNQPSGDKPVLGGSNVQYEVSGKIRAIDSGGLGMLSTLVDALGLTATLDERLSVLKQHKPYFASDHVMTMAFN